MSPKPPAARRKAWRSALFALLVFAAACGGSRATDNAPLAGPQAPAACVLPYTESQLAPTPVKFDQCYERQFSHGGENYTILTYYTLTDLPENLNQCTPAQNQMGVCEHAIPSANLAIQITDEVEQAIKFHVDRSLDILEPGPQPVLRMYIKEGAFKAQSVPLNPRWIIWDDETLEAASPLIMHRLAHHESHHLAQFEYYDEMGLPAEPNTYFFGEGNAQAIEDRIDAQLDNAPYVTNAVTATADQVMITDSYRTTDIAEQDYYTLLWWTWLWDQYSLPGDVEPLIGWAALRDFYLQIDNDEDVLLALSKYIAAKGSTFRDDFIDYTLALYAHKFNPNDPRLGFLDAEIRLQTKPLAGHNVFANGPAFAAETVAMNPRSSRYWEFTPASQCQYVAFTFHGHGKPYGFSLLTVDGGVLQGRWTSYGKLWSRAVNSASLDRVAGVVTAVNDSGQVTVGRGCVSPSLNIKDPTAAMPKSVGAADDPRKFIVRLEVLAGGSPLAGLAANDFQVSLQKAGGGPLLPAAVLSGAYVQDNYWLIVQAPDDNAGAETGAAYDLIVTLDSLSDAEAGAVVYQPLLQEVMIVIDRSGSMNDNNKIDAARKAAGLLANELADEDQGGMAVFQEFGVLRLGLGLLGAGPGSHRETLEGTIAAETALGGTSIGSGLVVAADEQDAHGLATHTCAFVLLSDGMEIEEPHWDQVQAGVIDNGCPIHAIALGPEADEGLMQQIAGAVPGGSYDFADTSGSIPVSAAPGGPLAARGARPALASTLIWQNNLARVYDYKAVEIAGRQRIQTWAETGHGEFTFYVDDLADQLVIGLAWQNPGQGPGEVLLLDPNGDPAQAVRRPSSLGTNEVWEVANPLAGNWTLIVESSSEEYVVNVSVLSDYEMYLFTGAPINKLTQGVQAPILVGLVSNTGPLIGASVTATVRAPNGQAQTLALHDDGAHLDGEANDGIYGNLYTATGQADVTDPNALEGQEPKVVGSYQVIAVADWNQLRRETRGSFAILPGPDEDGDGLPDDWEAIFGLDDPNDDPDGDGLDNECEFNLGTDPQNSDTDGGGQSDGSEAPECSLALQDPFDPDDDLVGQVALVKATPESDGQPYVLVRWSPPLSGSLAYARLWRRLTPPGGPPEAWMEIAPDVRGQDYEDRGVRDGFAYEYRLIPYITPPVASAGAALQTEVMGAAVETGAVTALADPYPPIGTILIDDGAPTTADLLVTLSLSASDSLDLPAGAPSTATDQLLMQISNSPDFAGAAWVPFQPEVQDWNLGPADPGDIVTVYVQFKDAAGNVGGGANAFASIQYQPGGNRVYLPIVQQ